MSYHEEKDPRKEAQEINEAAEGPETREVCDEDLEEVAGGKQPTEVNCGIID